MSAGYTIGVRGCQHLGYAPTGFRMDRDTGWNQRITDGHFAHEATMRAMLAAGVDGIVDGGDLTHWNKPLPRDVEAANRVDDLRAEAGVWAVGNSGNHCAGGGNDLSAMGVMHRPALGMSAVYPDPRKGLDEGVGPFPGLYEVHTSQSNTHLPDGLALHFISHYGLSKDLADAGVDIDPQPLPGHVNLFFSHGVFATDERLYQCIDPHGEERAIPGEWALRGWDAMILSHYHTLGAVPGYETGDRGQVWYTGSALRRGFSDEPGMRGWLAVTVHDTGRVSVEAKPIWQRPQHDLPTIDATDLTVTDLDDLVTEHLGKITLYDPESARLTGHGGAIVRQRITGTTPTQRQGLAGLHGRFATLTADAAWWGTHTSHHAQVTAAINGADTRAVTARITDFGTALTERVDRLAHLVGVPDSLIDPVTQQATTWAANVATNVDRAEADHATLSTTTSAADTAANAKETA